MTIEPPVPWSRMRVAATCASRKLARTSTSKVRSKVGGGEVEEGLRGREAGVVHEHVDAAEFLDDVADQLFGDLGIGQVAVHPGDLAAQLVE